MNKNTQILACQSPQFVERFALLQQHCRRELFWRAALQQRARICARVAFRSLQQRLAVSQAPTQSPRFETCTLARAQIPACGVRRTFIAAKADSRRASGAARGGARRKKQRGAPLIIAMNQDMGGERRRNGCRAASAAARRRAQRASASAPPTVASATARRKVNEDHIC